MLAHGGGGRLTAELIRAEILPRFGEGPLAGLPDAATLPEPVGTGRWLLTTDGYVVQPREFPGGNIGSLAVYGTVNDLAVCGGRARWLALALIIEEGLDRRELARVLDSVRTAADRVGVVVATGDTKVVPRGQCDGLYVVTTGLGTAWPEFDLRPDRIEPGDQIVVSGTIGDHGIAVLAARERLAQSLELVSDSAPVLELVEAIRPWAAGVKWMRDPTRGGVAATLNELVSGRPWGVLLHEHHLPCSPAARALAELLGLDLLHVACEGRIVAVCSPSVCDRVVTTWRQFLSGAHAAVVGTVTTEFAGMVAMDTAVGGRRLVDMPLGELLPRIC